MDDRPIADANVACVLAYSIVMLHTDQHNPQVRRRMTFEDYARNVRGVNNGKDFDVEFLVRKCATATQ
jgi:brefeldin A-resistance guanine nucleotide exchange factor 1